MDGKLLKDIIGEALDHEGWHARKLAEATGISENYIRLFLDGNLQKLPPAPYVKGYLNKIAVVLELDKDDLWQTYKDETGNAAFSGPDDRLPTNRFAIQSVSNKIIIFGALGILIIIYLGWNIDKMIGLPNLKITLPSADTSTVTAPTISIEGQTDYSSKLTINGEQIYLDKDGSFVKEISLEEGLNSIEIIAKKFLGREIKITKKDGMVWINEPLISMAPCPWIARKSSGLGAELGQLGVHEFLKPKLISSQFEDNDSMRTWWYPY